MIETALISLFTANAAVNALISGRICPFTDGNLLALPRLTYWRSNCQRPMSNDGPTGQAIATFQIDAWAVDGLTAYQLLDSCRQAANGFSGTVAGVKIDSIRFEDQNDQINVQVLPGRQKATQRSTAVLVISFTETLATPASGFSTGFSSGFN